MSEQQASHKPVLPGAGEVEGLENGVPPSLSPTSGCNPNLLPSLVSVPWLAAALRIPVSAPHPPSLPPQDTIHVFDCSWYLPSARRDPRAEYEAGHIPTAHFFDIDQYCDTTSPLPHMLPSAAEWSTLLTTHHIGNTDTVVLYDASSAFCASTRVWMAFLYFGHSPHLIRVLDGGYNEWKQTYPHHIDTGEDHDRHVGQMHRACGSYIARPQSHMLWTKARVLDALKQRQSSPATAPVIIDARDEQRYRGEAEEPRPSKHRGHIPGAVNLPHVSLQTVLTTGRQGFKAVDEVRQALEQAGVTLGKPGGGKAEKVRPVVVYCGSGVTAATVLFAAWELGARNLGFYDGSAAEWLNSDDVPIEK